MSYGNRDWISEGIALRQAGGDPHAAIGMLEEVLGACIEKPPFFDRLRAEFVAARLRRCGALAYVASPAIVDWARTVLAWPDWDPDLVDRQVASDAEAAARSGVCDDAEAALDIAGVMRGKTVGSLGVRWLQDRQKLRVAWIVSDRMHRLFFGRPALLDDDLGWFDGSSPRFAPEGPPVTVEDLAREFVLWLEEGATPEDLAGIAQRWCWSRQRMRQPDAILTIVDAALAATEYVCRRREDAAACEEAVETVRAIVDPWWLHAAAYDGADPDIPHRADRLLRFWSVRRSSLTGAARVALDRDLFGAARFAIEAAVQHLARTRGRRRASYESQVAAWMEDYSGRLATAIYQERLALADAADELDDGFRADRVEDDFIERLTAPIDAENFVADLPPGSAFLGLYDLPRCADSPLPGRPFVAFAVRAPDGRSVVRAATSDRGDVDRDRTGNWRLEVAQERLLQFEASVEAAFARYVEERGAGGADESAAVRRLAAELGAAWETRLNFVNSLFGPLIDACLARAASDLGETPEVFRRFDLVVAPRGATSSVPIDLLGCDAPLLDRFASIVLAPGLRAAGALWDRASRRTAAPRLPVRVGAAAWDPADPEGICANFFGAIEMRIARPFDAMVACVHPERTPARMTRSFVRTLHAVSDWVFVLGHGSYDPYGIRFADGLLDGCETIDVLDRRGPATSQTVFHCACFLGRMRLPGDRADALNPALEHLGQSLLFRPLARGGRTPTLVAGFAHQALSGIGTRVISRLMAARLAQRERGETPTGFDFARLRRSRLARILAELPVQSRKDCSSGRFGTFASHHPEAAMEFLTLCSLNFIGFESPAPSAEAGS